jgi:hypothetical protein
MQEVVMSQWFWPESGLQVPHFGGMLEEKTREAEARRREVRMERFFMLVVVVVDWLKGSPEGVEGSLVGLEVCFDACFVGKMP